MNVTSQQLESLDLLIIGIPIILLATAVVVLMVKQELGLASGMAGAAGWPLAAALGMGIVAFSIKLTAFAVISALPPPAMTATPAERRSGDEGATPARKEELARLGDAPLPPYVWQALPTVAPAPADNPTTPDKVTLGKRLFFDPDLSLTRDVSCASCHDVEHGGGADGRRTALGIHSQAGGRNAPTVWNAAFQAVLFWDGRAKSLEEQAKGPPLNPIEMGMPSAEAVARRVQDKPAYRQPFAQAFGPGVAITLDRIAEAIAAYERTLITPDTAYDRFVRGARQALSPAQQRGMALFQTTGCVLCHQGPNFSAASLGRDPNPYRIFPANASNDDRRYRLTDDAGALPRGSTPGLWRVPSLRNVALTAPYFHNGSVDSLEEAVRIMARAQLKVSVGGAAHEERQIFWSPVEQTFNTVDHRSLSDGDVKDIVAFLKALSSDRLLAGIQDKAATRPLQSAR